MKKKLLLSVAAATILSSSISVCAAPQYMADGAVFDPEWYLEQNPDVAGWALGTSADALYVHYTQHGAAEGRQPYNAATLDPANILPYQGTASQTQPDDSGNIIAVEGATYRFPSIHSAQYNYEDCMVNISFSKGNAYEYFPGYLADYTLPGYEWRKIDVWATTDASVAGTTLMDIDISKGDFLRVQSYTYDDSITSCDSLWDYIDENGWVLHAATFTVSHNGIEYPGCQLFETWEMGSNDYSCFSWYALVPEGFSGKLSVGYRGRILENGKTVVNESSPHIFFNF